MILWVAQRQKQIIIHNTPKWMGCNEFAHATEVCSEKLYSHYILYILKLARCTYYVKVSIAIISWMYICWLVGWLLYVRHNMIHITVGKNKSSDVILSMQDSSLVFIAGCFCRMRSRSQATELHKWFHCNVLHPFDSFSISFRAHAFHLRSVLYIFPSFFRCSLLFGPALPCHSL